MIAAFGKNGDIETAFALIDEMKTKGLRLSEDTFSHLLMACISDKQSGFRLALSVYRQLLARKCQPDLHTFHLILRAVRDCGPGSANVNDLILEALTSREVRKFKANLSPKLIEASKESNDEDTIEESDDKAPKVVLVEDKSLVPSPVEVPNLLSPKPKIDLVIGLNSESLNSPGARLALLGDVQGFLGILEQEFELKPDIKIFSLLLNIVQDNPEKELIVLEHFKSSTCRPDVDFFNQLIRIRARRKEFENARNVLDLMVEAGLNPDIVTFGCLALCCDKQSKINQMLQDMKTYEVVPNCQIMTSLIFNCKSPRIMLRILKITSNLNVEVDEKMMQQIEKFRVKYQAKVRQFEVKGSSPNGGKVDLEAWTEFCDYYSNWLRKTEVSITKDPWLQFKTKRDLKIK